MVPPLKRTNYLAHISSNSSQAKAPAPLPPSLASLRQQSSALRLEIDKILTECDQMRSIHASVASLHAERVAEDSSIIRDLNAVFGPRGSIPDDLSLLTFTTFLIAHQHRALSQLYSVAAAPGVEAEAAAALSASQRLLRPPTPPKPHEKEIERRKLLTLRLRALISSSPPVFALDSRTQQLIEVTCERVEDAIKRHIDSPDTVNALYLAKEAHKLTLARTANARKMLEALSRQELECNEELRKVRQEQAKMIG